MIFNILKTLYVLALVFITLIFMALITPFVFLFTTQEKAYKIILMPIIGVMVITGYDKDFLVSDVQQEIKNFN